MKRVLATTMLLFSCGAEEAPEATEASAACTLEAPLETWETSGAGILKSYCQGCHASTAPERFGAPDDVTFDTREDALRHKDRILARATSEPPTMPPNGGTPEEERQRLRLWLECYESVAPNAVNDP